jgi:hypothetical protein
MSSPANPRALRAACTFAFAAISALSSFGCGGDDSTFLLPGADAGGLDATTGTDGGAVDGSAADAAPADGGDSGIVCTTGTACNGQCVDLNQGRNCGACGNACSAGMVCDLGSCASFCGAGTTACNESCVNTLTDAKNCGACNAVCPGGEVCSAGTCGVSCGAGLTQCAPAGTSGDAGADGGVSLCIDMLTDRQNCGGCGLACASGQVCSEGTCAATCQPGLVNCSQSCVDPKTSGQHCGATAGCGAGAGSSGTVCPSGQVCTGGTCQTTCLANEVQCDGSCIDPLTNPEFCGAKGSCTTTTGDNTDSAGSICPTGEVCSAGACAISCQPSQVKCGDTCIDPTTSLAHCGATADCAAANAGLDCTKTPGTVCTVTNGTASCAVSCPTGEVACNGICIDPLTNDAFCGAKGTCATTQGDANDSAGTNCTAHPGTVCDGKGSCSVTCAAGEVVCNGTCVDPTTNPKYCGVDATCAPKTGTTGICTGNQVCNAGTCATTCAAGFVNCNGVCVDPTTDSQHCGVNAACAGGQGTAGVCPNGTVCTTTAGVTSCSASCGAGLSVCTNECVNEQVDPSHCGSCNACVLQANTTADDCSAGVCKVGVCQAGYSNCNGTDADGCEVNSSGDTSNCGACGHVCTLANVSTDTCTSGACGVGTCGSGFANCDSVASNGCEVDIQTDAGNCGGCGNVCPTGEACVLGTCGTASSGTVTLNQTATSVYATAGQSTATVGTNAGLAVGQEVILHQTVLAAGGAGAYERATITGVAGATVTFSAALAHSYTRTNGAAQLVVVEQDAAYEVSADSTVTAPAWNGTTGGILAIDVGSGPIDIAGTLTMSGAGYRGGNQETCRATCHDGLAGEGTTGTDSSDTTSNNDNGGGGGSTGQDCGMGGGGSYGSSGGFGPAPSGGTCSSEVDADPGAVVGSSDLTGSFIFGGGGGGGGADEDGDYPGKGGNGGGAILLFGGSFSVTGTVSADGQSGDDGNSGGACGGGGCGMGGGGGGAGGAVRVLVSGAASLGAGEVHGVGGGSGGCSCGGVTGASGGDGRVDIHAASLTGTSSPTYSTN